MQIKEHEPLGPKTTMRIGGTARYFAELATKEDVEEAYAFAESNSIPLIILGSGSNTIFADGEIDALVIRISASGMSNQKSATVSVESGKNLPMLVNELAKRGLDLSPLTGIPGTIGGAIFGNAGQGPKGIWIDRYVKSVTIFDGAWRTLTNDECRFSYRESIFKNWLSNPALPAGRQESARLASSWIGRSTRNYPILWSVTLEVPVGEPSVIQAEIDRLLKRRIETQPHQRTAGSCFKAVGDTPAWQLIEKAGLRGYTVGDVSISTKHANFLISGKQPKFSDAMKLIGDVRKKIPEGLEVEMRCIDDRGNLAC